VLAGLVAAATASKQAEEEEEEVVVEGCGCMDWIELPEDGDMWRALVNAAMHRLFL
jgi:hypothetical protein